MQRGLWAVCKGFTRHNCKCAHGPPSQAQEWLQQSGSSDGFCARLLIKS